MFETMKQINLFYIQNVVGLQLFHKCCTYSYILLYLVLQCVLPKNIAKLLIRKSGIDRILLNLQLKDGLRLVHHISDCGIFLEHFLRDEYRLMQLRKGAVVIDVGAQIGVSALICSKRRSAKQVICFEPSSDNFKLLQKNIAINSCRGVQLHRVALSDKTGTAALHLRGTATHSLKDSWPGYGCETVAMDVLDNYTFDLKKIDLIKIDVEGAEADVLRGSSKTLTKTDRVIVEVDKNSSEVVCKILDSAHFTVSQADNLIEAIHSSR